MGKCNTCIHSRICKLWQAAECQNASCYTDDCYTPVNRWIPVTERLPDKRQLDVCGPISSSKVLFKTSDKTIHLGYLIEDSYVDAYAGKIILYRWYDDHGERVENVTKWFEPPKEEDDA